jgi:hypothetical protein
VVEAVEACHGYLSHENTQKTFSETNRKTLSESTSQVDVAKAVCMQYAADINPRKTLSETTREALSETTRLKWQKLCRNSSCRGHLEQTSYADNWVKTQMAACRAALNFASLSRDLFSTIRPKVQTLL